MRSRDEFNFELEQLNVALKVSDLFVTESKILLDKFISSGKRVQINSELDSCIVGLIVYFANRSSPKPLTLPEIAYATDVENNALHRQLKVVSKVLELKFVALDSSAYIYRFGAELKLSDFTISKAIEIVDKYKCVQPECTIRPLTLCASALYISAKFCNEKRLESEVSDVVGVTEVALRNTKRRIYESLNINKRLVI